MTRHTTTQTGSHRFGTWVRSLIGRSSKSSDRKPALVTVWDAQRETYRTVDLNNRNDPLWSTAYSLAGCSRDSGPKRTAA